MSRVVATIPTGTNRADFAGRSPTQPMGAFTGLPSDWVVWSDEGERSVLAYRPDVFDSNDFPAACLPTIYLTHGRRDRRPGTPRSAGPDAVWYVTLFLEPEIERDPERFETREDAVAGAVDLASRFARGEIEYRDRYQVARLDYLDRLDELTGRRND